MQDEVVNLHMQQEHLKFWENKSYFVNNGKFTFLGDAHLYKQEQSAITFAMSKVFCLIYN